MDGPTAASWTREERRSRPARNRLAPPLPPSVARPLLPGAIIIFEGQQTGLLALGWRWQIRFDLLLHGAHLGGVTQVPTSL